MIKLRPYQVKIKQDVYEAWQSGHKNVLLVMPTGMGKTKTFCSIIIDDLNCPTAVMVHRKELVQQICLTLAEEGISHNIIAPLGVIKGIIAAERRETGRQFYNPHAAITVISVDTLNARIEKYRTWAANIRRWITDEAAHVLADNKWGRACKYFPNAIGLGVTATPERLDRKGLGSHVDGVFDVMVQGPSTAWGITNGYLAKYKVAIPESDYQMYLNQASNGSDYSKRAMSEASTKSRITGDVVKNYIKFANGKQAIVFASDIATAFKMEKEFIKNGIKAKCLTGETPDQQRIESLLNFRNKEIQVLINVDLFDEGLDVPGIECVIMARPTMSLGKFLQMVGRGLRVAEGKHFLVLIDHVGNIKRGENGGHGLPCKNRLWTLDRTSKRGEKLNFIRICSNIECASPYDRSESHCPWCGTPAIINSRAGSGEGRTPPEMVDGDLYLIDPETLRELEVRSQLEDPGKLAQRVTQVAGGAAGLRALNNQVERISKQTELVKTIAQWAGEMKTQYGWSDRKIHKHFYLHQSMTISEALAEKKTDMERTIETIEGEM